MLVDGNVRCRANWRFTLLDCYWPVADTEPVAQRSVKIVLDRQIRDVHLPAARRMARRESTRSSRFKALPAVATQSPS